MRKRKIAVVVETVNAYGRGIISGISDSLRHQPACAVYFEERTLDMGLPGWLNDWHGDGIIVRDRFGKCYTEAQKTGAVVVDLSEQQIPGSLAVYTDNAAIARMAAYHLHSCQFNHYAYVGIRQLQFSCQRRDAFLRAVGICPVYDFPDEVRAGPAWEDEQTDFIEWLAKLPKPVGIMTCNDRVGMNVLKGCLLAGFAVPEQVAVIGVDNDEVYCSLSNPPMTSVEQNTRRIGYDACELLFRILDGKAPRYRTLAIPPIRVVRRKSTDVLAVPDRIVAQAIKIIREYACAGIAPAEVAARLNVSLRTLERRFLRFSRRTPWKEISETRIFAACELLIETDQTIENIAHKVGFASVAHFNRMFEEVIGNRPTLYRRINQKP